MVNEPVSPASSSAEPGNLQASADAILPWGERLDAIAQERFNRTDWIELAAAILLSLATIAAAWAAYQSTRWGGVQANSYSASGAKRTEATQQNSIFAAQAQIDVMAWITYLEHREAGDERGAAFLRDRFREEFKPAFDAWMAQAPPGKYPPGTPFELPEYQPKARQQANRLNAEAEEFAATAREANQRSDNFVLVAVVMASVMFFAGVGTKVRGRAIRLFMLGAGFALFIAGVWFMLSMPQSVGI
jgi:protein-S-isoprenylcysteine O-methyltransferase Ste14